MTARTHNFLWLDLETTGLKPRLPGARILEFALVLCADDAEGDLSVVDEIAIPIQATADDLKVAWAEMDLKDCTYVHNMHQASGLLAECAESQFTIADVDAYVCDWMTRVTGKAKPTGLVLAGFSVHFDRDWIRVHMPGFDAMLSHQVFDVSTLKRVGRLYVPGFNPPQGGAHRALADVHESIAAFGYWRQAVGL